MLACGPFGGVERELRTLAAVLSMMRDCHADTQRASQEADPVPGASKVALRQLWRSARRLSAQDPSMADDLVQETLLRAWVHRASLEQHENPAAWMGRVLRNACRDEQRRVAREATGLAPSELPSNLASTEQVDTQRDLHRALAQLEPPQRRVVELVDLRGLSYLEAAEVLACPVGTVMSRLARARAKLRQALTQAPLNQCAAA